VSNYSAALAHPDFGSELVADSCKQVNTIYVYIYILYICIYRDRYRDKDIYIYIYIYIVTSYSATLAHPDLGSELVTDSVN